MTNLTRSGYSDNNPKWVLDGKAMTWTSDRSGYRSHGSWGAEEDVYIMFFDGDAYDSWMRSKEEREYADSRKKNDDDSAAKEEKDSKKDGKKDKKNSKDSKKADAACVRPCQSRQPDRPHYPQQLEPRRFHPCPRRP